MKMDLERIGARSRNRSDANNTFAAESEALDQIAKEVSGSFNSVRKTLALLIFLCSQELHCISCLRDFFGS